jgi:hypothetical protein
MGRALIQRVRKVNPTRRFKRSNGCRYEGVVAHPGWDEKLRGNFFMGVAIAKLVVRVPLPCDSVPLPETSLLETPTACKAKFEKARGQASRRTAKMLAFI